ncbi:MAG TPA: hypothetical protein VH643_26155 [Gemmataceae bacterium]|jgi:hypothetical protein
MAEMMHCLVNYFGYSSDDQGRPLRYYSYHVVGGPGPTDGSGSASITLLAAGDPHEIYQIIQHFHVVREGGAVAAIERAVRYLDSFHAEDRLRKVRTEPLGSPGLAFSALMAETPPQGGASGAVAIVPGHSEKSPLLD